MADNTNSPGGSTPPKARETGKIQPRVETVRISLPPKPQPPTTVALPALPGSQAQETSASAPTMALPTAKVSDASASAPTMALPSAKVAEAAKSRATSIPTVQAQPAPSAAYTPVTASAPTVGALDTVLALAAALVGLAVVVRVFTLV